MRRNKEQIMIKILDLCKRGHQNKTAIVYQANLNFRTVAPYLELLVGKGYLEEREGGYVISRVGEEVLACL